ncbi:MAG: hypothetical protein WCJ30_23730 [Deltaproteobacteria bacterium]
MRLGYFIVWLAMSVGGFVWVRWNRVRARRILEDFDAGTRCIACEKSDVTLRDGVVHCNACGQDARLDQIRRSQISNDDLESVTARRERRL